MRRLVPLALVVCFTLLGSGAIQRLHDQTHDKATSHTDSQCPLCIQLQLPLAEGPRPSTLIGAVVPAGVVATPPGATVKQAPVEQITCRGPPQRSLTS